MELYDDRSHIRPRQNDNEIRFNSSAHIGALLRDNVSFNFDNFHSYITGRVSYDFIIHQKSRGVYLPCVILTQDTIISYHRNGITRIDQLIIIHAFSETINRFGLIPREIMLECFVVSEKYRIR